MPMLHSSNIQIDIFFTLLLLEITICDPPHRSNQSPLHRNERRSTERRSAT